MRLLRSLLSSPLFHISTLTCVLGAVFLKTTIVPMDDNALYQRFIETLARGTVDLSIPGFHGASFLALPFFLATGSALSNIYTQIICSLLLPAIAYGAARALLFDKFQSVLFAYAVTCMPFVLFLSFRGFTFSSYFLLVLLTLALRSRGSRWAWLPLGLSVITKPFSIALLPFFLLWKPIGRDQSGVRNGWVQMFLGLFIPVVYVIAEELQIGHIIVGAHPDITQNNVFPLWRLPLNAAHGVQMLFSIHNFYFVDPAKTSMSNALLSSPVLMALGMLSLLYPQMFWKDRRLALALGLSAALAFLLACALDHMDQLYLGTTVLLLAIASLPVIARFSLLLPIVLATLHFQFFYTYLAYRGVFFSSPWIFVLPATIDVLALAAWMVLVLPDLRWKQFWANWA
ncbi:MAG: hypothetical protein V1926_05795 [Candidatus Peregrinibacteria bacterium]